MKTTGIIRRLDDLGRLVIPKEIRKQYRLTEGDSIEFFIENERIVLQKYDSLSPKENDLLDICEAMKEVYHTPIYFIQNEIVGYKQKPAKGILNKCCVYRETSFMNEKIFEIDKQGVNGKFLPLVIEGYWQGSFIIVENSNMKTTDMKIAEAFIHFLSRKYHI